MRISPLKFLTWLVKYRFKESHNVLRYTGDLHVMNKRSIGRNFDAMIGAVT